MENKLNDKLRRLTDSMKAFQEIIADARQLAVVSRKMQTELSNSPLWPIIGKEPLILQWMSALSNLEFLLEEEGKHGEK